MALSCKSGGGPPQDGGVSGGGGSAGEGGAGGLGGGGNGGEGGVAGVGGMAECNPGSMRDCYSGPPGTANVGACTVGSETCNAEGTGYGACEGEVLPGDEVPTPPGGTPADEDCDGMVDELA
jgi:hypothetical protein